MRYMKKGTLQVNIVHDMRDLQKDSIPWVSAHIVRSKMNEEEYRQEPE